MSKIYFVTSIFICVLALPYGNKAEGSGRDEEQIGLFDTHQTILDEGYPAETHHVTTHDGYILEMSRIPYSVNQKNVNGSKPVVFMMHGFLGAASSFIFKGSEYSIGFHLADAGFDVWMGNARGNHYSRFHVSLDPDHPEEKFDFFDFTFEEIGMYDLAAMIDYILDVTGREQLHYIGHSQGGTAFLVLSTMRPDYNKKIKAAHLLAAVGYQEYFPNADLGMLARFVDTIYAMALLEGIVEFFPINLDAMSSYNPDYCFGDIKYKNICDLAGARILANGVGEYLDILFAGASLKQVAHFGQNIRDKVFRRWDYGNSTNIEMYGTSEPPKYNLNLISTLVTMYYTVNDILLDEKDVLAMAKDITHIKVHKIARKTFSHFGFVTAEDAKEMVTDYIVADIWKIEEGHLEDWVIKNCTEEDEDEDENKPNSASELTLSSIVIGVTLYILSSL